MKALSRAVNARSHELYEQEAAVLRVLPPTVPAARLHATVTSGDWLALIVDFVPGPVAGPPWTAGAVAAVARACAAVGRHRAMDGLPPVRDQLNGLDGWAALAAGDRSLLTDWERRHVDRLAAATAGWPASTAGAHLAHQDVRADNALLTPAGAVLIDWGFAAAGAPWLNVAGLATDVACSPHVDGPAAARRQAAALLAGQPADAARYVVALAGRWRRNSARPAHPGMPTHRAWQRARADALQPLLEELLA